MSDPKQSAASGEKDEGEPRHRLEIGELELSRETLQDLTTPESEGVLGGAGQLATEAFSCACPSIGNCPRTGACPRTGLVCPKF